MDLGMSREIQVSIPMPSNYPHIQDTSRIQQIYGTKGGGVFTGVVEGLNPPEDLRSQVQAIRPSPSTHINEPMSPATRNANGPVPPHPSVIEDMRTHQPHPGRPYPQHETNRISNNGSPNVEGIVPSKPVRYRECRKNHAASIGGYAVDGCGEFMPSGQEGTPAALKCAACNCHRNFHRREVEGEARCDCHHTRR